MVRNLPDRVQRRTSPRRRLRRRGRDATPTITLSMHLSRRSLLRASTAAALLFLAIGIVAFFDVVIRGKNAVDLEDDL